MSPKTELMYFLLRKGATQEEQWTWCDLEEMCRAGELQGDARVFLDGRGVWVPIAETELADSLVAAGEPEPDDDPVRETLEDDYQATVERLRESPESVDALIDAGALACELGDGDAAREHFQKALDIRPFHARTAGEIKRRFSRAERSEFRALERPAPAWDDLRETVLFAFSRGPLHAVVPAAILAVLGLLHVHIGLIGAAAMLWMTRIVSHAAEGGAEIPAWGDWCRDGLRRIAFPAVLVLVICAEAAVLVTAVASGLMVIDKTSLSAMEYVAASPLMTVSFALISVAYLPAALLLLASDRPLRAVAPWRVIATITKVGHEYAVASLLFAVMSFVCALIYFVSSAMPAVATITTTAAVAILIPPAGFVLGTVLARHTHIVNSEE